MAVMLAIALALGSSVCYGVSNFVGPQLVRRHTLVAVLIISQLAALAVCAVYVVTDGGRSLPSPDVWLALLAGVGNAGGLVGFYKAAELGPLSVAAPIGATGAVVPVVWGLSSGDALTAIQIAGVALAMCGVALAARRTAEGPMHARHYDDPRRSAIWAAGSAVAFGVFLTALPAASAHGQAWALFDARLGMVVLLVVWAGRELRTIELGRGSGLLAIPGLLLVTGTLMYTAAAAHGPLSLVSVLGSLFPVFTVALGVVLLQERLSPIQTAGVVAALGGVVLMAV
jgi:drug/metabolite transporter (DMT)-like permease